MDRSLKPTFDQMNDYCANYTVGNVDINQRLRAINRAIEDVHRNLGLTCDETIFNFPYAQDNMFTDLPEDYDEPILLYYEKDNYNLGGQSGWSWDKYTNLLQNSGRRNRTNALNAYGQKKFSSTNINGKKQLIQNGANVIQGSVINPYTTTNLTTTTGDATSLAIDNNVFVNTGGSLSFTIDPTLGFGYAGIKTTGFGIMSFQQILQQGGLFKCYHYLQSLDISSIEFILTSSAGNYYTFNVTDQDDGTPFDLQTWFKTAFDFNNAVITGSPDVTQITSYEVRYNEGAGFGVVPISYFRIDDLYSTYPDAMNLVYYSQYKGTDSTGTTPKIILDSLGDLPNFMQFFPDFLNMVALRGAYVLMPQLSGDKDFMKMYKDDYEDALKDYGKIYPRKRIINLSSSILRRP